MAWRPRKSIRLGKGFRINLSRKGIGWSSGLPGIFRFGVGSDGRRRGSVGKGLLRQEKQWGKSKTEEEGGGCCGCIAIIVIGFVVLGIIGMFISANTDLSDGPMDSSPFLTEPQEIVPPSDDVSKPTQQRTESTESAMFPTATRTWRSTDGRTLLGRVVSMNEDLQTVTIIRADGTRFENFPINKLHPEDAALLTKQQDESLKR